MSYFTDPEGTNVFTCEDVFYHTKPILCVGHGLDGLWIFHCGEDHEDEDALYLSLKRVIDLDRSVLALADLPKGKVARRPSAHAPWEIE